MYTHILGMHWFPGIKFIDIGVDMIFFLFPGVL